jgi:tetratricopeptide (TPR) repeat protein
MVCLLSALAVGTGRAATASPQEELRRRALDYTEQARAYQERGEYKRAIELYDQALALSPRPVVLCELGTCYSRTGDLARAEEYLTRALDMDPTYTQARYELDRVRAARGKGSAAPGTPAAANATPTPAGAASAAARETPKPPGAPSLAASARPSPITATKNVPAVSAKATPAPAVVVPRVSPDDAAPVKPIVPELVASGPRTVASEGRAEALPPPLTQPVQPAPTPAPPRMALPAARTPVPAPPARATVAQATPTPIPASTPKPTPRVTPTPVAVASLTPRAAKPTPTEARETAGATTAKRTPAAKAGNAAPADTTPSASEPWTFHEFPAGDAAASASVPRPPVMLVDDGSDQPAHTADGRVPRPLPDPTALTFLSQSTRGYRLAAVSEVSIDSTLARPGGASTPPAVADFQSLIASVTPPEGQAPAPQIAFAEPTPVPVAAPEVAAPAAKPTPKGKTPAAKPTPKVIASAATPTPTVVPARPAIEMLAASEGARSADLPDMPFAAGAAGKAGSSSVPATPSVPTASSAEAFPAPDSTLRAPQGVLDAALLAQIHTDDGETVPNGELRRTPTPITTPQTKPAAAPSRIPKATPAPAETLLAEAPQPVAALQAAATPPPAPKPTATPAPTPPPSPTPALPSYEDIHNALFTGKHETAPPAAPLVAKAAAGTAGEGAPAAGASRPVVASFGDHFERGKGLFDIKEYDRALDEFASALALQPGDLGAMLGQGDCYARKGRADQALQRYQEAAKLHPDSPKPSLKIGNLYLGDDKKESVARAIEAFNQAAKLDPACKEAYNNLGVIAMRDAKNDEAAKHFEKAIDIDETFADAHLNLGIVLEETKKNNILALHHYTRYVELHGSRSPEVKLWIKDLEKK